MRAWIVKSAAVQQHSSFVDGHLVDRFFYGDELRDLALWPAYLLDAEPKGDRDWPSGIKKSDGETPSLHVRLLQSKFTGRLRSYCQYCKPELVGPSELR